MKRAVTLALLLAAALPAAAQQALPIQPMIELDADIHRIEAEVVSVEQSRERGLMFRKSMPDQHGMLFVFPAPALTCMWMRNTLIPLSVAFMDERGRVINIEDMQPRTENNHCTAKPAKFALEMNVGVFKRWGVGPGSVILGVERAPAGR
jgi:uncharacterized membrane protein (UPF0127 family)